MKHISTELSNYIIPFIGINKNPQLSKFIKSLASQENHNFSERIKFEELIEKKFILLLGEPGYGKSRLLKQLFFEFKNEANQCCFIDLKKVSTSIKKYVKKKIKNHEFSQKILNETHEFYCTLGFKIKSNGVLFIDGLDEIHSDEIPTIIEEVKSLQKKTPNLKIFLSCRTHHITRFQNELFDLKFECIEVQPFSQQQTIQFLKENCPSVSDMEYSDLFDKLRIANIFSYSLFSNSPNSTLATPRYLEVLAFLINEKGFDQVINFSRSELFDMFITERLKKESKKKQGYQQNFSQKIPYIKQCLERLALVLEIQRVNQISQDDFNTFQFDTQMNLDNQILLEVFYDGTILKNNGNSLEFDNTEFQEFLAAKALTRLGRTEQVIFDLAVEQKIKDVFPSWINTLSFVVEIKPELLLPIINIACWSDNHRIFELIKFPKPTFFEKNLLIKNEVFTKIFNYYLHHPKVFPYRYEEFLFRFFNYDCHYNIIKNAINIDGNETQIFVARTNVVNILKEIFQNKILSEIEKEEWKKIIFPFLNTDFKFDDLLHRSSIQTLKHISTIEEFEPYLSILDNSPKTLRQSFLMAFQKINPNHPKTIDLLIENIKRDKFTFIKQLDEINSVEGFEYFLSTILNEDISIHKNKRIVYFLYQSMSYFYNDEHGFIFNLKKVWNKTIEQLVLKILLASIEGYIYSNSEFFNKLCSLFKEKNARAGLDIFEMGRDTEFAKKNDLHFARLVGKVLNPNHFEVMMIQLKELSLNKDFALWSIRHSDNQELDKFEKIYFPKDYKKRQKLIKASNLQKITQKGKTEFKDLTIFNKFVECLNKEHLHIIRDYSKNQKIFESRISSSQILKIRKLIKHILTKYDPRNSTDNKYVSLYEDAVKLGLELKVDLTSFRAKILSLLSFTYEYQTILGAIPNPTKKEIHSFFKWYTGDLDEGLKINRINNFIDFCEKFNLKGAEGFLLKIINDDGINHYSRNNAIYLIFSWNTKPISFFKKIFNKYSQEEKWSPQYRIALFVNELLLEAQDEDAFNWRVNETFNLRYQLRRNFSGVRSVSPEEGIGKPLSNISSTQLYPKILSLLDRSLKCLEENAMYYRFVESEIWDFIVKYFRTLRKNKHEHNKYLIDLNSILEKNKHVPDANAFYFYIEKIKNEFISFLGEPEQFSDCIKKYLSIKQNQYIDIVYPSELFQLVQGVINNELRQVVEQGLYKFVGDLNATEGGNVGREKIIQRSIVSQLENFLLKKGLRASDINEVFPEFYREVEIPDGKKVDLIITYGTVGKVMVEIKRAGNSDLSSGQLEDYKNDTFLPYMNQTNSEFGIYLIFRDNEKEPVDFESQISRVKKVYSEFSKIVIIGIDCIKTSGK